LYNSEVCSQGDKYIQWISDVFLSGDYSRNAGFIVNNAFSNWGHQFIYDAFLMTLSMRAVGFSQIVKCEYGESTDAILSNIETHGINAGDIELVKFETMIFEASKPVI
jgi:hypothetical protein